MSSDARGPGRRLGDRHRIESLRHLAPVEQLTVEADPGLLFELRDDDIQGSVLELHRQPTVFVMHSQRGIRRARPDCQDQEHDQDADPHVPERTELVSRRQSAVVSVRASIGMAVAPPLGEDRWNADPCRRCGTRRAESRVRPGWRWALGRADRASTVAARCGVHDRLLRSRVRRLPGLGPAIRTRGDSLPHRASRVPRLPWHEKFGVPYPRLRRLFDDRHFNFMREDLERLLYDRIGRESRRGLRPPSIPSRKTRVGAGEAVRRRVRAVRSRRRCRRDAFRPPQAGVRARGRLHPIPGPLHRCVRGRRCVGPRRAHGRVLHDDGPGAAGWPLPHPRRPARDVLPAQRP